MNLLSIDDIGADGIDRLMKLADAFEEVAHRPIPKVPALRGRTISTLFLEDSTRTRLSFEAAAKMLSADTMSLAVSSSSMNKGESLRDTVQTLNALGADAFVVRHSSAGAAHAVSRWTEAPVVNAGDGWHEHPTQALLDCYTLRARLGSQGAEVGARPSGAFLQNAKVAIVGDVKHSRVARSCLKAFSALGGDVSLVGPSSLMPPSMEGWPASVSADLDELLPEADVIYLLRLQSERSTEALIPSLREYTTRWGLTSGRVARLKEGAVVMHPGPMNRGVEIAPEVADLPFSLVTEQVAAGVVVRAAVLFSLLGGGDTP